MKRRERNQRGRRPCDEEYLSPSREAVRCARARAASRGATEVTLCGEQDARSARTCRALEGRDVREATAAAGSNRTSHPFFSRCTFYRIYASEGPTLHLFGKFECNLPWVFTPPQHAVCCVIPGPSDVACDLGRATDRAVRAAQRLRPQRHHLEGTKRPLPHAPPQP
jgi:hypothetical protein